MKTSRRTGWIALGCAAAMLAGCISARRSEPLIHPAPPMSPAAQRGEPLYMKHCQQCHPGGDAGIGPALNNKRLPAFAIRTQVRWGFGAMPKFSKAELPPQNLSDIVEYLKALRARKLQKS
jgi:mono/diheme cytochrome c family protein